MGNHSFWAYWEEMLGQSAPWVEWQSHLAESLALLEFQQRYLQLSPNRAAAIECPSDCDFGCPRDIVKHADDDIVAVCPEKIEKRYSVSRHDILIYSLKRSALHQSISTALGIECRESKVDGCRKTWRLGDFVPTAGISFPIYLTQQETVGDLLVVVKQLCLLHDVPFVLLAPTRRRLSLPVEQLLAQRKAIFLSLEEEFSFTEQATIMNRRSPDERFAPLIAEIPDPASGGMEFFVTPPGISWREVKIQFQDGHTVTIWAGKKSGRFTYIQMGMASRKSGNPNKQWELLDAFARNRGAIDWDSPDAGNNLKKQKQELSQRLRSFFRLDGDPIEWVKDEKSYRCVFSILPEGDGHY